MRTNLFLSTLFAVSLLGGAAMADKPGFDRPARMPHAIEAFRSHGDVVDKVYRGSDSAARQSHVNDSAARQARSIERSPLLKDRAASRINCSDTGTDCGVSSRSNVKPDAHSSAAQRGPSQASKSPLASKGNERVNCNDAEDCNISSHGAAKTWAGNGVGGGSSPTEKPGVGARALDERTRMQPSDSRMACNEADECMMSSKDSKKIWAVEAVKAGTFNNAAYAAADKADKERAQKAEVEKKAQAEQQKGAK